MWALGSSILNAYLGSAGSVGRPWPNVAQIVRVQRVVECWDVATRSWQRTEEVAYAITSLSPQRAQAPELLRRWRAHWQIENGLHWIRDVTFGEDASQIFTGQAPEVFTALRNAALPLLCSLQMPSVAAAMRHMAQRPEVTVPLFDRLSRRLAGQAPHSAP